MSEPGIELSRRDDVVVAVMRGEIDISNTPDFEDAILQAMAEDAVGLVVDLSQVGYVDSAGVRMFFEVARHLDESRQVVGLIVPEESPVRKLLEITNLEQVAKACSSLDESIAHVRSGAEDRV